MMRLEELSPLVVAQLYRRFAQLPQQGGRCNAPTGKTITTQTLRSLHKLLHSTFEQAVLWEYLQRNPFHGVSLPKSHPNSLTFLVPEQVRQLLDHCSCTLMLHMAVTRLVVAEGGANAYLQRRKNRIVVLQICLY